MGEVWKALDTRLQRVVAIKVSKEQFSDRFMNEARAIAALSHPNICTLFDVGPNYLVMEFIEGVPLAGPMAAEKALLYSRQILDALDAAHKKGFTHRDLKPANILITKQGIKLLDFGLATQTSKMQAGDETVTRALSGAGEIAGTLQYMAPEQLEGRPADARSDLFAFGCVLYELLSGKRAFAGTSAASVIAAILEREPAALQLAPPLDRVLRTCLAKDPDARFQSALDLKRALDWAMELPAGSARRPLWAWAVAGVLAAVALLALWALWRAPVLAEQGHFAVLDIETGTEEVFDPAISADGKTVVFVADRTLRVRRMDSPEIRTLAGTEGAASPFVSTDGKWVAYYANMNLFRVSTDGGVPELLLEKRPTRPGVWMEDGSLLSSFGGPAISRFTPKGGEPVPLTDAGRDNPAVLPGGKGFLVESRDGVSVVPPDGGKGSIVMPGGSRARYIDGGFLVFYRDGRLYGARFNLGRMGLDGPEVQVIDGVDSAGLRGIQYEVSTQGHVVYRKGRRRSSERVIAWLMPGGEVAPVLTKPGQYSSPRLSPDGKRMALTIEQQGEKNIWLFDLTSNRLTRLTQGRVNRGYLVWTPDAGHLIYELDDRSLGWIRTDGGGTEQKSNFVGSSSRSLTPDGKRVLFNQSAGPGQGLELAIADLLKVGEELQIRNPTKLLQQPGLQSSPGVSPDGKWIAYHSDENVQREIFVRPFPASGPIVGAKWQVSTEGGRLATWARSGNQLFWKGLDQRIWVVDYREEGGAFKAGKPRIWTDKRLPDTGTEPNFDVSADGKRVLVLLDAEAELKPETHLRVVLNIGDEIRRKLALADKK